MTIHWGIDLGTSNTTICEDRSGEPRALNLPELARVEPLSQTPVVPSCVCVTDVARDAVLVGREAMEYNWDGRAPGWMERFKPHLGRDASRVLAALGGRRYTARDGARLFLRGVLAAVEERTGQPVSHLTLATPTAFFETYRAELREIVRSLDGTSRLGRLWGRITGRPRGVRLRFVDEPVAAALGYGVDLSRSTLVLAFDFGAGTMEAAALQVGGPAGPDEDQDAVGPRQTTPGGHPVSGRARVLAKNAVPLGGRDVDQWILDALVPRLIHDWPEWDVALRWEAERVKLLASAGGEGRFTFRNDAWGALDYGRLQEILRERGLYEMAQGLVERVLGTLRQEHGIEADQVQDVLLEGGSTLLPGIRDLLADLFGRDRIREWLPFESVARGACLYARGEEVEDFIYHDYAIRVAREDGEDEFELLIPRGTRYPTAQDHVTRWYASGFDGQEELSLFVCEVGGPAGSPVGWEERTGGNRYYRPPTEGARALCPCLNEAEPAIPLRPSGSGTSPRLRVSFGVDGDRWLRATIHDLQRKEDLAVGRPVVRLR